MRPGPPQRPHVGISDRDLWSLGCGRGESNPHARRHQVVGTSERYQASCHSRGDSAIALRRRNTSTLAGLLGLADSLSMRATAPPRTVRLDRRCRSGSDGVGQGQLTGEVFADVPVHDVSVSVVTVKLPTSSTLFFASCTCTLVVVAPVSTVMGVNPGRCRVTR